MKKKYIQNHRLHVRVIRIKLQQSCRERFHSKCTRISRQWTRIQRTEDSRRWSYPRDILRWKMELKHQYLFFFRKVCLEYKSVSSTRLRRNRIFSRIFHFHPTYPIPIFSLPKSFHFETPVSGDLLAGKVTAIMVALAAYLWKRCCHSCFEWILRISKILQMNAKRWLKNLIENFIVFEKKTYNLFVKFLKMIGNNIN